MASRARARHGDERGSWRSGVLGMEKAQWQPRRWMQVQRWRTTALACQSLMFQRVGGGDESSPRRRKGAWQESAMCVSGVGVVRRPRRIGSPTGSRSSVLPSGPLLLPTPSVFAAAFCVVVRQLALRFRVFKHLPTRATAGRTEGGRAISVHLHFLWPVGIRSWALNCLNRQNSKCAVQNQPLRDECARVASQQPRGRHVRDGTLPCNTHGVCTFHPKTVAIVLDRRLRLRTRKGQRGVTMAFELAQGRPWGSVSSLPASLVPPPS